MRNAWLQDLEDRVGIRLPLELVVVEANVFIKSVFQPETFGDDSKRPETKAFIEPSRMFVCCYDGVELQYEKS